MRYGKNVLTMDEYIDREALLADIDAAMENEGMGYVVGQTLKRYVKRAPAADVAKVRHGRWERTEDGAALCTACNRKMNPSQYGYAFCSLCGAIMDG